MIEVVVALLMIVNGEIKEHRIQESMSQCLKGKRIAMRTNTGNNIEYHCIKNKAETEIYLGAKSIKKTYIRIMKNCKQCKKEFEPKEEFDMFCNDECKQEALADLDKDSDECLSCQ